MGISKPLMIYANGYPRPYLNDPAEDASASADTWLPSSVDFQATAANSWLRSRQSRRAKHQGQRDRRRPRTRIQ